MPEKRLIPLEKANITNTEKTGVTNFFATDLSPSFAPSLFRIMIAVDVGCKLFGIVTVSGSSYLIKFNNASDLNADVVYMFDMLVHVGDTINFQLDSTETLIVFRVQEIPTSL